MSDIAMLRQLRRLPRPGSDNFRIADHPSTGVRSGGPSKLHATISPAMTHETSLLEPPAG